MSEICIAVTSVDRLEVAQSLAREMVELRLAACVNVVERVHSTYRWKGAIETAEEVFLVMKASKDRVPRLQEWLVARHPYELPEFLVLPVSAGSPNYIAWVLEGSRSQ